MIQMQTKLEVADNSGAKSVMAITVLGQRRRVARVGDIVTVAVQKPFLTVLLRKVKL